MTDLSEFTVLSEERHVVMTMASDIVLYLDQPFSEITEGVQRVYDLFMSLQGPEAPGWYLTNTMTGFEPAKPSTFKLLPTWLKPGGRRRDRFSLELKDSASLFDAARSGFGARTEERCSRYFDDRSSLIRFVFPPDFALEQPERLHALVLEICQFVPFISGHAGLVFERSPYHDEASYLAAYAKGMRYRTIDIADARNAAEAVLKDGIKTVSWITIVSNAILRRIGGETKVRKALAPAVGINVLPNGAIFTVGPAPILGDLHRNHDLSGYRAVAKLLEPMLEGAIADYPPFTMGRDDNNERTEDWLRRLND